MEIIVSADDIGLTRSITDGIVRCIKAKTLTSVSLMTNGYAYDEAVAQLIANPPKYISVHLNTLECHPVSHPKDIPDLLSPAGKLHMGFLRTWLAFLFASPKRRAKLKQQFKSEYRAQILKYVSAFGQKSGVRIDSHQHLHMIPFLFDVLLDLNEEFKFAYVRIPREPLLGSRLLLRNWQKFRPISLVKNLLLRVLSARNSRLADQASIPHTSIFLGVMFPGRGSPLLTRHILDLALAKSKTGIFEFLIHPGRASESESHHWMRRDLSLYYLSPERDEDSARALIAVKHLSTINGAPT